MIDNSKKIAVIYKSKYGSTERYAKWITEEVNADLFKSSEVKLNNLLKYDTIIYGGSLYASGILGLSIIKKHFDILKHKKIIVFSVGASPAHPEALEHVKNANFTEEMKKSVEYFHLRGGFNYNKLNPFDKILMFMLKKKLEHKKSEELTDDEKGMLGSYSHPDDWTNKDAIIPIVKCVKN